jgi:shikimate kinase
MPSRPAVVLCGPIGSDTTATGRALAGRLGLPFHDTDEAIEAATGRPVGEILVVDGEPAFRALERATALRALAEERGVVSLGGGAVLDPDVQSALAGTVVVFLDVRIADAAKRMGLDQARPLLAVNPRASWTALMNERRPVYEAVSTIRVDTSGRTPDEVADEIVGILNPPAAGHPPRGVRDGRPEGDLATNPGSS